MEKLNLFEIVSGDYPVIGSENYFETMDREVIPELEKLSVPFIREGRDGHKLSGVYYRAEKSRGTVMISHGFTESCDKYREMIWYFLREGFSVCIHDHREHGLSRNEIPEHPGRIATHIEHFQDYVDDFHVVAETVLQKELPAPYFLYAHSMGGAVGALYAEQHPEVFSGLIFNAPMFEINRHGIPYPLARLLANGLCFFGRSRKLLPGQSYYSEKENFEKSPDTSKVRYRLYHREQLKKPWLQNAGSSCRWAAESFRADDRLLKPENIGRIRVPVLLFQSEKDDFVYPGGQDSFMKLVQKGKLIFVPGEKHEIFMGVDRSLKYYLTALFDFLGALC